MDQSLSQTFFPDWRNVVTFSAEGPQPRFLVATDGFKALVAGLEAGQKIPPHSEKLSVFHFLEGTGWMVVDDQRYTVKPGTTVIAPEGSQRGMEADTRLVFLAAKAG